MEHPLGFDQVGQEHNGHGDQEITNDEKLGLVKRFGPSFGLQILGESTLVGALLYGP